MQSLPVFGRLFCCLSLAVYLFYLRVFLGQAPPICLLCLFNFSPSRHCVSRPWASCSHHAPRRERSEKTRYFSTLDNLYHSCLRKTGIRSPRATSLSPHLPSPSPMSQRATNKHNDALVGSLLGAPRPNFGLLSLSVRVSPSMSNR